MTGREDRPRVPFDGDRPLHSEVTLPVGEPERVVYDAFEDVENAPLREALPSPTVAVRYRPVVDCEAVTRAVFETSAGVVHRIESRDRVVAEADARGPKPAPDDAVDLVGVRPVPLEEARAERGGEAIDFDGTGEAYREWVIERLRDELAEEVTYTGADGENYTTECRPSPDDVSIRSMRPLYVPRVEATVELGEYRHRIEYDAAGSRRVVRDDGIRRCVHCETAGAGAATYTYCENCGSVACETHTETERLTGDPVCTGCAVTGEFFFASNHFFDEENLETFREAYESMPLYRKPLENPALLAGLGAAAALAVLLALVFVVGFG